MEPILSQLQPDQTLVTILAMIRFNNIVAYLLKTRTVETEKQPVLGNSRTQQCRNCHERRYDAYN
jgi:hypothetical protein